MELKLKPISSAGINEAIAKVELYRNLNEPGEAESICRDILAIDPNHQAALRLLGLAITDQFKGDANDRYSEASLTFRSLTNDYERTYYCGLLHERKAKAQLHAGRPPATVIPTFEEAMRFFEDAEKISPSGICDPILRWNRCVRLLQGLMRTSWEKGMDEVEVNDGPPVNVSPFSAV
jgi:hypothetical protein